MKNKIVPFLWFNDNAEAAMKYYVSTFKKAKITCCQRHGKKMFLGAFEVDGQRFMLLNGGPHYRITPGISFFVRCQDQREVDYYWNKLSKGGKIMQCGWLTDQFGVSWQIIPETLGKLMSDPDPEKSGRVYQAMLKMTKINVKQLEKAHAGK